MTPARVALLAGSLVILVVAAWLVFLSPPAGPKPAASGIAAVPSQAASGSPAASPAQSDVASSRASTAPSDSPAASFDALAKEVPPHSVDPAQLTGYIWPVNHAIISGRFAPRPADQGGFVVIDGVPYHDGLDLVTHCDDKVRAAHNGTVLYAGRNYDPYLGYEGNAQAIYDRLQRLGRTNEQAIVVVIDDGNGYRSIYVHLAEADVQQGQVVQAGDFIGLEGATGFASGCHVHYGLIRMDGPWQQVVPRLYQFGYPQLVRERINPLDVLNWGDPNAPQVLQDKVNPPSPAPEPSATPASSATPTATSAPTPDASPTPTPK